MPDIIETIQQLTNIPSPTGYTAEIIDFLDENLKRKGYQPERNHKGSLMVTVKGAEDQSRRFVTAHIDTLGAMVRAIKPDGRLKIDLIGGFTYHSIDGEYCTVHSAATGKDWTGTILLHQTSVHVYKDARTAERNQDNMEIRLDAEVHTAKDVSALGIGVGDFISFAPRTEITPSGYIKSRHLDDKASAAILLQFLHRIADEKLTLPYTTCFFFSNNEEIGYGGNSNMPPHTVEYLAVDMGAMGDDQQTDEYTVSICVKDGSGPYHFGLRQQLVGLCESQEIPYKLDIYPFYGSDASAAMKAGWDVRHALIGPGIDASHAYERTHRKSLEACSKLLEAYLSALMIGKLPEKQGDIEWNN